MVIAATFTGLFLPNVLQNIKKTIMKPSIRLNTKLIITLSRVLFLSPTEIMQATSIASSTWYRIMAAPAAITIQQLLSFANGLHIPVRRFFSEGRADIIGRKEDYIVEPYKECSYDSQALQEFVNSRPDATWKLAAEATGLTRSRLRDSLLAVTRTPVTRFLVVCDTFGIEPFMVLIDPNKGAKVKTKADTPGQQSSMHAEIQELRKQVAELSGTIADLTQKYDSLFRAQNMLARRISVNIEHVQDSQFSIAAEPVDTFGNGH